MGALDTLAIIRSERGARATARGAPRATRGSPRAPEVPPQLPGGTWGGVADRDESGQSVK